MRTKNILWAAMTMTAALMMTSCSSDDVQDWPTPTTKTIPYTVTVSQGTRATVDEDLSTLRFAEGDKLTISGTNISGVLDMTSAVGQTSATFSGNLTYTGAGEQPAEDLSLTATLVSAQQEQTYPTDKYCATVDEAVKKYSKLTGTGTYGAQSFALSQGTAFLNFKVTFDYGVTSGTTLPAVVTNNGTELSRANVTTTTEDGKVVAKFVLPIADGTTLINAMVMMGSKIAFIHDATLAGKVYNLNKTIGAFTINASGDKVLFAPGNLQATYDGSDWTWAFAEHQWDYIGNAAGNTSVTATSPYISGTGTVDLFGWVGVQIEQGEQIVWTGVNKFGITSSGANANVYGNNASGAMMAEWNSTNLNITNGGTYAWRTLTIDEWYYVLTTRKVTVNGESKASYGLGKVILDDGKEVNGLIILPDGWDGSVEFTYGNSVYTDNTYSTTSTPTWSQMEAAGCVFLPAAGVRPGNSLVHAGTDGYYWSSTAYPSNMYLARSVNFGLDNGSGHLYTINGDYRQNGHSVRLVRAVE